MIKIVQKCDESIIDEKMYSIIKVALLEVECVYRSRLAECMCKCVADNSKDNNYSAEVYKTLLFEIANLTNELNKARESMVNSQ